MSSTDAATSQDRTLAARLDQVIDRAIAERQLVGAVVLVAREGRPVYARAAGQADREAGRAMQVDTIFRLASITKPIVTAAIMRLVEDGRLELDQPVTRWLPAFRPRLADGSTPEITLRQLLSHSSGLGYRYNDPEGGPYHRANVSDGLDQPGLGLDENLDRLAGCPLYFPPGTSWRYSLGIDVAGRVLEKATGQDLRTAVAELVTGPLAMRDTDFAVIDENRLAGPYADGPEQPVRMVGETLVQGRSGVMRFEPDRHRDPGSFLSAGGGMIGTAPDFLRFLETIRTGGAPILAAETVRAMMVDQVGSQAETQGPGWGFGLGWAVLSDPAVAATPQGPSTIQWGGAYGHSWFIDPTRAVSVVAFSNTAVAGVNGAYPEAIRDAVFG
ncbi:serine hydrolase domain-containing protein [Geminicoccus roseus]|uniref:serine hydrolase domain-containing protein n=1 Tax=Geminicoccus roseus TaxID=404900 RepID=UPI0003F53A49|nr:serine hydrolase domain-containing protein [Geminicoccus roseus]